MFLPNYDDEVRPICCYDLRQESYFACFSVCSYDKDHVNNDIQNAAHGEMSSHVYSSVHTA